MTSPLIEVNLSRILIRETNDQQFIGLQEKTGERSFQIVIGSFEAREINRKIMRYETPRPMTHDLVRSAITQLGATFEKIVVDDLRDQTFFAKLHVTRNGETIVIDCRPSDAVALAVAAEVPIFVAEHVLEEASKMP
jgi:bifunctional DNase/RNase